MNKPEYIILHHTAVSRSKNSNQFDAVKRYHISKGWGDIGYHWIIEPNGEIKKGRSEREAGAHCSQERMNYRSIGVCLTGNFDIEDPTKEQLDSLKKLIEDIQKQYGELPVEPHRKYATYKSCPGTRFTDNLINSLMTYTPPEWAKEAVEWAAKKKIITKVENYEDARLCVILHNFAKSISE